MDEYEIQHYNTNQWWDLRLDIEEGWVTGVTELYMVANQLHHQTITAHIAKKIESEYGSYENFEKATGKKVDAELGKLYQEFAQELYPGDRLYYSTECQDPSFYDGWSKSKTIKTMITNKQVLEVNKDKLLKIYNRYKKSSSNPYIGNYINSLINHAQLLENLLIEDGKFSKDSGTWEFNFRKANNAPFVYQDQVLISSWLNSDPNAGLTLGYEILSQGRVKFIMGTIDNNSVSL